MMKYLLLTALLAMSSSTWAADAARGAQKAQTCVACHGAQGAKPITPDYPILAGQVEDYLVRALLDYKTGARKNAIMAGQAATLSKQDIEDLAAYFAAQPSPLHVQK